MILTEIKNTTVEQMGGSRNQFSSTDVQSEMPTRHESGDTIYTARYTNLEFTREIQTVYLNLESLAYRKYLKS